MKFPLLKLAILAGVLAATNHPGGNVTVGEPYSGPEREKALSLPGVRLAQEQECTIICKKMVGGICVEEVKVCQPAGGVRGEKSQ